MQKQRLTVLFLINMDGSGKEVFIVGKSNEPRCFQRKDIPLPYFANLKAWMNGTLWSKILKDSDCKMVKQKRKVLLFADNADCHKLDKGIVLKNVTIQFLPPNTTSLIQPLDQDIIYNFKVHHCTDIVRKQLWALKKGLTLLQFGKSLTVLDQ